MVNISCSLRTLAHVDDQAAGHNTPDMTACWGVDMSTQSRQAATRIPAILAELQGMSQPKATAGNQVTTGLLAVARSQAEHSNEQQMCYLKATADRCETTVARVIQRLLHTSPAFKDLLSTE